MSIPYHAVIGLAGHVDHGKTALIHSLTGMQTARRHEQAIGMTQDLGFAHYQDEQNRLIGVIDVPGHERYIRNMVASLWSLDLVLLVIAADEGWMAMTGDHLRLIKAMKVPRLLICINKADLVAPAALAALESRILERVLDEFEILPELVCVSAKTGQNMAALRQAISAQLSPQAEAQPCTAPPRLYVDRVFTVNGTGTVLTGTLQQGELKVGDKLMLYPAQREVQVRSLQAYHRAVEQINGPCRVAVGLKKVPHKEVYRGHLLSSANSAHHSSQHLLVRCDSDFDNQTLGRNKQVEIALGTFHSQAQFIPIAHSRLARLQLPSPAPCFFGQAIAIIQQGSSQLLASASVVWCDEVAPALRKRLYSLLNQLPADLSDYRQASIALQLNGYVAANSLASLPTHCQQHGAWWIDKTWFEQQQNELFEQLKSEPYNSRELSLRLHLPTTIIDCLLMALKQRQPIRLCYDKWQIGHGNNEEELSDEARLILKLVRDQGKEGYEPGKQGPGGVDQDPFNTLQLPALLKVKGALQKQLNLLARLKYLVQLEGPIYYDCALYQQMVQAVLVGLCVGSLIDMASIKARTGLSRKYAIPFCLKMEQEGWMRRQGNDRQVLRLPECSVKG